MPMKKPCNQGKSETPGVHTALASRFFVLWGWDAINGGLEFEPSPNFARGKIKRLGESLKGWHSQIAFQVVKSVSVLGFPGTPSVGTFPNNKHQSPFPVWDGCASGPFQGRNTIAQFCQGQRGRPCQPGPIQYAGTKQLLGGSLIYPASGLKWGLSKRDEDDSAYTFRVKREIVIFDPVTRVLSKSRPID